MKLKLNLDLTADELARSIEPNLRTAVGYTTARMHEKAKEIAARKLKKGLKHWNRGLKINTDRAGEGVWILSIEGKLAGWMEEGFSGEEFKQSILTGNRAKYNEKDNKKYVDVPIEKSGASFIQALEQTRLDIGQVTSGVDVIARISDWKKKGVVKEKKVVQRAKDIIKSRGEARTDVKFMTIRRVTEDSTWNGFGGTKVLEDLDFFIEQAFENALNRLL